jgi:RND family efflux transporter MFP subunit
MQKNNDHPDSATMESRPSGALQRGATIPESAVMTDGHGGFHQPVHAQAHTGAKIAVFVVLLAAGLAATYFVVSQRRAAAERSLAAEAESASETAPVVSVTSVQYGPPTHIISLPGETRAWYESTIYARVSGYLAKWEVDIGDPVKAGQILATIDTPELDHQLVAAQAKEATSEAQLKLAQAAMHFSEVTFGRYKDAPKGVVSDLERDERDAEYQTNVARVAAAESDLNSAKAEVGNLEAMIDFQKVRAPYDGIITERRVDIGDLVTAGSTANTTSLFRMAQSDQLRVFVDVPQETAPDIHDGDDATAIWNGKTFDGKVARNSRAINMTAKTLRVEVDIPNPNMALLPGTYLMVEFKTKDEKPLLQVSASAMNFRSGGPSVAVVSNDGHVRFHPVTIARDLGTVVEIASGLSPGDRVALNISNQISDGDVIKPLEETLPGSPAAPADSSRSAHNEEGAPARVSLNDH